MNKKLSRILERMKKAPPLMVHRRAKLEEAEAAREHELGYTTENYPPEVKNMMLSADLVSSLQRMEANDLVWDLVWNMLNHGLKTPTENQVAKHLCGWADRMPGPNGFGRSLLEWISLKTMLQVEREDRPDGIFSVSIIQAPEVVRHRGREASGVMFQPFAYLRQDGDKQLYFPKSNPGEEYGTPLSPALPLNLYDLGLGRVGETKSRAAPLALRIFVEACLSVRQADRYETDQPVLLPRQTLREFLACLYPSGHSAYRKGKHFERLLKALEALESDAARIPWRDKNGRGSAWRVVSLADKPLSGHLDDYIQFQVHLPPGSERGPLIDRPLLIRAGALSASKYRLALSLSFWWCNPGTLQVPVKKGVGRGFRWMQLRNSGKYPEVSDDVLVSMTYPGDTGREGGNNRMRYARSVAALNWLVSQGFAALAPTRRIYPGPKWAGWNYQEPRLFGL